MPFLINCDGLMVNPSTAGNILKLKSVSMNCFSMNFFLSDLRGRLMQFTSKSIKSFCSYNGLISLFLMAKNKRSSANDPAEEADCKVSLVRKNHFQGPVVAF